MTILLLIVLVLSVWCCTWLIGARLSTIESRIEAYLLRIAMQQVPDATRLEIRRNEDGKYETTLHRGDAPKIVDPRGPKEK